jgi:hypothetical protein
MHTLHPVGLVMCFSLVNAPVEGNLLLCGTTFLHVLPCRSGCPTALLRVSLAGFPLFTANRRAHMFKPCLRPPYSPRMVVSMFTNLRTAQVFLCEVTTVCLGLTQCHGFTTELSHALTLFPRISWQAKSTQRIFPELAYLLAWLGRLLFMFLNNYLDGKDAKASHERASVMC